MNKKLFTALLAGALAFGIVTVARSAATATAQEKPALKSVSCPPECGFMVRSHDEHELVEIVKAHAKEKHGLTLTDQQVKEMIRPVSASEN
jgi:predicted small metal-binding protein